LLVAATTDLGTLGEIVSPHLRARYSSTVRRSVLVTARLSTMTSPMSPSRYQL
jgi:hypothetical protein